MFTICLLMLLAIDQLKFCFHTNEWKNIPQKGPY